VTLDAVRDRIAEFGDTAYLVTVGEARRPHIVSVHVTVTDDALVCPAGRSTSANVASNPIASLVWPAADGGGYALLVDGDAAVTSGKVTVVPTSAVLHRTPGGAGPACLPA
jgi:hypothetical protein